MKITETRVYRGPNPYAYRPVIRLTLDLEAMEEWPSDKIPGFADRLVAALPTLHEHGCSYGRPGGFVDRLREGTWFGHILEHVAIELQCLAGNHVTFGKTRGAKKPGVYHVVYSYLEEQVGRRAGQIAFELLRALLPEGFDDRLVAERPIEAMLEELREVAADVAFGPSTKSIVDEAKRRGIPVMRLDEQGLVQLGWGARQQRIQATVTGKTSAIGVELAQDKSITVAVLDRFGVPVPRHKRAFSADEAAEFAEDIGYPVVVKPMDLSRGRGITLNLRDAESVRRAWTETREMSRRILVEQQISGRDHRILVIAGKVVAVAERVPARVVGDGEHSIRQLVELTNRDPRRGDGHDNVLTKLEIDEQVIARLERHGHTPDTVLPRGEVCLLCDTANLSTGGTAIDRTDEIHPDNALIAVRAARVIGLDVAGIDLVCEDIGRSILDGSGAVIEVNAAPGFRMHLAPSEGTPRNVAAPVVDHLFPRGDSGRIPIVAITGTNGKTTVSRMVAHILGVAGRRVGLTTTDGIYVGGERIAKGDMTGPWSARVVLSDPAVDVAVLETARGGILREGLGWDRCDVGCVLNISADHLGLAGVDTVEELAEIKRIVVEVVRDDGVSVLNADDPLVADMAEKAEGQIVYFSAEGGNRLVLDHVREGGRAAVIERTPRGPALAFYQDHQRHVILHADEIPATLQGKAWFNVANALAAAACASSLGCSIEQIQRGLATFTSSFAQTPGRCNIYDGHPFRVLVDYGHNPAAMGQVVDLVCKLRRGRAIGVVMAAGDRRDEDVRMIGRVAASGFDIVIAKEDSNLRGRAPGAIARLLREGAEAGGLPSDQVYECLNEPEAIELAMTMAQPGDLVAVFADDVDETWKAVTEWRRAEAPASGPRGTTPDEVPLRKAG